MNPVCPKFISNMGVFKKISSFYCKILFFRTEIHKMLVRVANREGSDQTASLMQSNLCQSALFGRQLVYET